MNRPIHHVVLLLLCCLWSGEVVSGSPTKATETSSTPQPNCDDCCSCSKRDSCSPGGVCPPYCEDINCDDLNCECCGIRCGFAVEFMVAAQIALGAALLLAVSALSFLIWKMCFRNSIAMVQGRNRVRAFCGLPELPRRGSASSSLNSVQNFVIQKMRDRPPRYDESLPEMPPCYDEISPSCATHPPSSPPVTDYGPATLPLYEQIYPGTSGGESSNAADIAAGAERLSNTPTEVTHQDSGTTNSARSNENARHRSLQVNTVLYDEACGGMINPAFIPDFQEQHI